MITQTPCKPHKYDEFCAGYISYVEEKMAQIDPSHTAQQYHEILDLFEFAFDKVEDEAYARTKQASADQAGS